VLIGGTGNDVLTGGPGADTFRCGPGKDTAAAGPDDTIEPDCELVTGLPSVAIADAGAMEGDAGSAILSFPVVLSKAAAYQVVVRYTTRDGTATAPVDYTPASGSLNFGPGETQKTIEVSATGDLDLEPDETLQVTLSGAVDASIGNGSATGTIQNDDVERPRSGRYSGTTSQGRPIGFDVSGDGTRLSNLSLRLDFTCAEVQVALTNESLEFGGGSIPIVPKSWTFGVSIPISEADYTANFSIDGTLSAPGSARGSLRFDIAFKVQGTIVHCSSGAVSWSAG
jgi:Calx-beta domain-containing protein/hemolysin type calcium-binding protein